MQMDAWMEVLVMFGEGALQYNVLDFKKKASIASQIKESMKEVKKEKQAVLTDHPFVFTSRSS